LVEIDHNRPIGVFEYARVKLYIAGIFQQPVDVVSSRTLKPLLRENILQDAIHVF
jgi:predicted nucleotidyltransferase